MSEQRNGVSAWASRTALTVSQNSTGVSFGWAPDRVVRWTRLEWKARPDGGIFNYHGGNYCGPGWGFTLQDVVLRRIDILPEAKDAIDRACAAHDQCYADHGYFTRSCNVQLAAQLSGVIFAPDSSGQQRIDAAIIAAIFATGAARVDPWAKPLYLTYETLEREYRQALKAGATFLQTIDRGIRQLYGMPGGF